MCEGEEVKDESFTTFELLADSGRIRDSWGRINGVH